MTRELRAERYIEGCSPSFVSILRHKLAYWSYAEAMEFYADITGHLSNNELALLGCNDRFFLTTALLNRPDAFHPWLYERAREIEADPDGYLDLYARYHYKSTFITFAGSIQEVMVDPEVRIAIFSNNKAIAHPFVGQIKEEWESNELLKEVYADVLWQTPRTEAPTWSIDKGLTVKRKSNPRECTIEGHGLIDALPTGKHFPILTYDDVITEKNVTNPEQIKKAVERVELSFPIGIGEATRKRFCGTRYSYADAYGHLIEKKIAIPRLYPATDDGTIDGNPVFLTASAWAKVLREMRSTVAAQMLQNPIAGKENVFFTKWLKPYWVTPIMMNVYIMGDPSMGRSASSDRTALAVVGIDSGGNKYLLDGYCHRMKLAERWQRLAELWRKWKNMPCTQGLYVGYERYGMQTDMEYFDEQMRLKGPRFEIKELAWVQDAGGQSKGKRVGRLEPDFRHGNFFVPGRIYVNAQMPNARWRVLDPSVPTDDAIKQANGGEEFHYEAMLSPHNGAPILHQFERRAQAASEFWRLSDPLRRVDEDANMYDLTRVFFEELRFFPFSPHDDLIDAVSRIYDMDPLPAVRFESVEVEDYVDS